MSRRWSVLGLLALTGCQPPAPTGNDAGTPEPNFCFTRPKLEFCEDFDTAALPGGFDSLTTVGGTAVLDGTATTSAPSSALLTTTASRPSVAFTKRFSSALTYKTFLQLRVDARPASGEVELAALEVSPADRYALALDADGTVWLSAGGQRLGSTLVPLNDWVSVRFDVGHHDGGTPDVTLRLGDTTALFRDPLPSSLAPETPSLSVGLGGDAGAGWAVRYDTITFIVN
ncbi:MAG: hypothetical protein JNG84_09050 [Archangium sp.]|nr:hypothetical protein [Archangium sp.]